MTKRILLITLLALAGTASAQTRIATTIASQTQTGFALGREFWFSLPSNDNGQDLLAGKYIRIYITSTANTTAYVQLGPNGATVKVSLKAYSIGTFDVPSKFEMESSGIVEAKGIHVWSKDADLVVYFMSRSKNGSDGSYIIPTIGWGTDYVVAAYGALFEGFGNYVFDLPSEFTITANVDNTVVTITPSTDLRASTGWPAGQNSVAYPKGQPFQVALNRGQCVQYEPVKAQDADNYDVTGTIIHSNNPIGVIGGSQDPNIPADFPYGDPVFEMIPPVREWGATYYATNFEQPAGMAGHDFGLYLLISSKPGQTIYRHDAVSGDHVECIIDNKYGVYWDEIELAQKFWSDAPFLLVEYINSNTYPDGKLGNGDPAEVHITPREKFTQTVLFQTPASVGSQAPYDSYANVIVNVNDEKNTKFDGRGILTYSRQPIDDTFEIYLIPHIAPGAHTIMGDTMGVGVYNYGYGSGESYAWSSEAQVSSFQSPDTVAPIATFASQCYGSWVRLADSGRLPNASPQSKLAMIRLDSDYNMAYLLDPDWMDGAGLDTGGYAMYVIDPTKPAYLKVSAFDFAGNRTKIVSTYAPVVARIEPPFTFVGISVGGSPLYAYDTIVNTGQVPLAFTSLRLLRGDLGFTIDSMPASPIPVGGKELVKITFKATLPTMVVDSVVFGDGCLVQSVAVIGNGGAADFLVEDHTWPNKAIPPPLAGYIDSVTILNFSTIPITIDSGWWSDTKHFKPAESFPISVPASTLNGKQGTARFAIAYFPDGNSGQTPDTTTANWTATEVKAPDGSKVIKHDLLTGWAIVPGQSFTSDTSVVIDCAQPGDTLHFTFTLAATGNAPSTFNRIQQNNPKFINLRGVLQNGDSVDLKSVNTLAPGEVVTIFVDYPLPQNTNVSDSDVLTTTTIDGKLLQVRADVNVTYRPAQISPAVIDFGVVPYKGANVTQTFTITNPSTTNLVIDTIYLSVGGMNNVAYTLSETPSLNDASVGTVLQPSQAMTVAVTFDPSVSAAGVQNALVDFAANWCADTTVTLTATLSGSGVSESSGTSGLAWVASESDGRAIRVVLPSEWSGPAHVELLNVLGAKVFEAPAMDGETFDLGALPRGVYFYRLTSKGESQSGKIILGE